MGHLEPSLAAKTLSLRNPAPTVESLSLLQEESHCFDSGDELLCGVLWRGSRSDYPLIILYGGFASDHEEKWRAEVLCARGATAQGFSTFSYHAHEHSDSTGGFCGGHVRDLIEGAFNPARHALYISGAD